MAPDSPRPGNARSEDLQTGDVRLSARVFGVVQGVGFRFWTMGKADGPEQQVQKLLDWLRSANAPGRVERVEESITAAENSFRDFRAR